MPLNSFARFPKRALKPEVFATMKPVTVKVLACLADCLDRRDDRGRISVKAICDRCSLARRTVQLAMAELAELDLIDRNQQTGEYTFLPESGGAPQCAGAHGDARGGAPACAGGRTTVREGAHGGAQSSTRNKEVPRIITKNSLQEAEGVSDGLIPYNGKRVNPSEVHKALLDRIEWPENRRGNAKNLIAHALLAVADGAEGPEAASNPVPWLAVQLKPAVDGVEDPRFVPKIGNWFAENYPHLVTNAQPFGARRIYA